MCCNCLYNHLASRRSLFGASGGASVRLKNQVGFRVSGLDEKDRAKSREAAVNFHNLILCSPRQLYQSYDPIISCDYSEVLVNCLLQMANLDEILSREYDFPI